MNNVQSVIAIVQRDTQKAESIQLNLKDRLQQASSGFATELVRKSLHLLIAATPFLASFSVSWTMTILSCGALSYALAEYARLGGYRVPVISSLTVRASRERDRGRFVMGPITLAVGALLALFLYPSPAAALAIYALAFGDALASLVGRCFGRIRPAFLCGKSLEGSLACFTACWIISFRITGLAMQATVLAMVATFMEALPLEDYDNIVLPVSVGLVATFLMAG